MNQYVECHTGDEVTDICSEKLREWRKVKDAELVDLRSAYLQIKVAKKLWKYQLVKYKGKVYCLTRLGFGLSSAPRIMSKILKTVLASSPDIQSGTSSYIDDILVNKDIVSSDRVISHLSKYGLESKQPVPLERGAALGLKIVPSSAEGLTFQRGNTVPDVSGSLTRKELFSLCGKLVGHYPVCGWLRVTCSYLKRIADGTRWDDYIGDRVMGVVREVLREVEHHDPVKGQWNVSQTNSRTVWCDASSLALGVIVEIGKVTVEDAAWLRKKDDYNHINVAELEAVLKGLNLAIKWGLKEIDIVTDSATVYRWILMTIKEDKKVKTKGAAEIVVKRRLGIIKTLAEECSVKLSVRLVPSERNKADMLTRVRNRWMIAERDDSSECCAAAVDPFPVKKSHESHHLGVERTLYLAQKLDPSVTRADVKSVVKNCEKCQRIDPAPVTHVVGELGVDENWKRVAIDVTHYRTAKFLSLVDCGPGRFAIWREIPSETAEVIVKNLQQIFYEHGPVKEILMDNATAFRSAAMTQFMERWRVTPWFRTAYRASGNGVVERHHRTIKRIAERAEISPIEAVYWYNISPKSGQDGRTVPQAAVFSYQWRQPWEEVDSLAEESARLEVGDEVWVKPPMAKCTSLWPRGVVTAVNSKCNVDVNGVPRHILDVRPVARSSSSSDNDEVDLINDVEEDTAVQTPSGTDVVEDMRVRRYPSRIRQPPSWMSDYTI